MKYKPHRALLYITARIIASLLYPLPLSLGVKIGSLMGRIAFYILPKEREKTLAHLRIAFGEEKDEKEIRGIALKLFSNLGRNAIEWVNFSKIDKRWLEKHIKAEGFERAYKAKEEKRPIIFLASHFGNWEFVAIYPCTLGFKGIIVARRIYIEGFNRFFEKMRKRMGNEVAYRGESPKKILHSLNSGGNIGMLADQDVESVEGVFVDFFGRPAYTPVAPVKLAMRYGAAILPVFVIREGKNFRFVMEEEIVLDRTGDDKKDLITNTEKWTKVLERYIRRYPDQWVWMHRRWKTRPIEEKQSVSPQVMQLIDKGTPVV